MIGHTYEEAIRLKKLHYGDIVDINGRRHRVNVVPNPPANTSECYLRIMEGNYQDSMAQELSEGGKFGFLFTIID